MDLQWFSSDTCRSGWSGFWEFAAGAAAHPTTGRLERVRALQRRHRRRGSRRFRPTTVSLLFPAPTRAGDLANLIAVSDLAVPNLQDPTKRDPVWPDDVFQQFLAIAASPAAQVAGTPTRIGLPTEQ